MGFTCGIAVLIFSTQIKDFLGLKVEKVPPDFVDKLKMLFLNLRNIDVPTVALGVLSIIVIKTWPAKWGRRIPGSIIALLLGTLGCLFFHIQIETIGSRFGGIPLGFPKFHAPGLPFNDLYQAWHTLQHLFTPALTIALLAAIESLLSAVVADGMIDDRHDPKPGTDGAGTGEYFQPLVWRHPATGAIARTATNVRSGGRSPVSGIVHAFTLLVIILAAAPLARFIPLATLSAVLVVVAFNMGEWHQFRRLQKWPKSDSVVFLAVFALTVLTDLPTAVESDDSGRGAVHPIAFRRPCRSRRSMNPPVWKPRTIRWPARRSPRACWCTGYSEHFFLARQTSSKPR